MMQMYTSIPIKFRNTQYGFSLLELLISIALLGLVVSILYSAFFQISNSSIKVISKLETRQELRLLNNITTPKDLINYLNKLGGSTTVFIEEQLHMFRPKIILNQVRTKRDRRVGAAMKTACSKYFNLDITFQLKLCGILT